MTDSTGAGSAFELRTLAERLREQADTYDETQLAERLEKLANRATHLTDWRSHRDVRLALALLDEE